MRECTPLASAMPAENTMPLRARVRRGKVYVAAMPSWVLAKRRALYSQAAIAVLLGVHRDTVSRMERNLFSVHGQVLAQYCALLGYRVGVYPVRRG